MRSRASLAIPDLVTGPDIVEVPPQMSPTGSLQELRRSIGAGFIRHCPDRGILLHLGLAAFPGDAGNRNLYPLCSSRDHHRRVDGHFLSGDNFGTQSLDGYDRAHDICSGRDLQHLFWP
jgi:hypothetical protein